MIVSSSLMKLARLSLSIKVSHGNWKLTGAVLGRRQQYGTDSDSSRPISRFPVPYKKDLPYDIVELMEEVEKKGGFLPNVFKALAHRPSEFRAFFAYYDVLMNRETAIASDLFYKGTFALIAARKAHIYSHIQTSSQCAGAWGCLEIPPGYPYCAILVSKTAKSSSLQGNLTKADRELIIVATSASNKCPYCVTAHSALHRIYSKNRTLADQVVINPELADLSTRDRAMIEFALAVAKPENITDTHFQKLEEHGFNREDAWDIAMVTAFFAMANRIAHVTDLRPNDEFYALGRVPKDKNEGK